MEKYFCNYDQSLALNELGFREKCLGWYLPEIVEKGNAPSVILGAFLSDWTKFGDRLSAPLKSQVFEWIRKEYSGIANIQHYGGLRFPDICFNYKITAVNNEPSKILSRVFDTYEEAESACIDKLIEIIKYK